jgi:ribosomal protein L12E/L44/L45/RPP1/RPP2
MRVIAAYLLLSQSGNKPSADDVTSFLKGLEIEVDDAAVKGFFEKLGEQVRLFSTSR